jgi:L-threonylcarbamoyladenylate synthase
VYGVGGDPFDINVVNKLNHLKGRGAKPYPILVSGEEYAYRIIEYDEIIDSLIEWFWPGGLTIVSKAKYGIPANFYGDKVGVRMPNHEFILEFIDVVGGYLIGTSANVSGEPPSISIDMAYRYFGEGVDLYIDGGVLDRSSSTVVERSGDAIYVYRVGYIGIDAIKKFCKEHGLGLIIV